MTLEDGQRLRAFVERHLTTDPGWTLRLAADLRMSKSAVFAWFKGERVPSLEHLQRLGKILGVPRWQILKAMDGE